MMETTGISTHKTEKLIKQSNNSRQGFEGRQDSARIIDADLEVESLGFDSYGK